MSARADKSPVNGIPSTAIALAQRQVIVTPNIPFMNHRPDSLQMRNLQDSANSGHQVQQAAKYQALADVHSRRRPQPIQRMAAVAVADKAKEQDIIVASSLDYALKTAGGPLADFGTSADFSKMKPSEQLIVVHHGEKGKIGDYSGPETVDVLTQQDRSIPKHIGGITLMSCYSGVDAQGPDTSLADQVADGLKDKGYTGVPIKGALGPAVASPSTAARVVDPSKADNVDAEVQNALLIKYKFDKAQRKGIVTKIKTVDEILADNAIDPSKMTIEEKISKVGALTAGFYIDFIHQAGEKGYLLDPKADGVEITWVAK